MWLSEDGSNVDDFRNCVPSRKKSVVFSVNRSWEHTAYVSPKF